jgi:hypothetical protein
LSGEKVIISVILVTDLDAKFRQAGHGTGGWFSTTRVECSFFNILIYPNSTIIAIISKILICAREYSGLL